MPKPKQEQLKRLNSLEQRVADLRARRKEQEARLEVAKADFGRLETWDENTTEYKKAREERAELGRIDLDLGAAQDDQTALLREIAGAPATDQDALRGAAAHGFGGPDLATRQLLSEPELRHQIDRMSASSHLTGRLPIGEVADRDSIATSFKGDTMAADVTGTTYMRQGTYLGIIPQLQRRLRILDVIAFGTTDGNTVPYTQEGGTYNAAETAEGAVKPEDGVTYTDKTAQVQTIAGWQKIRKQSLSDYAALQSMIDGRLRYSVSIRVENQIVGGDGSDPNLLGILNTSGIGNIAFDSGVPLSELVLTGIVNIMLANGDANAIVLNPVDWKNILVQKASGSGEYVGGGPFQITPLIGWGVPLVPSPAVAQGTALVGDFARGAQLFIREGLNVLLSDSDQDDFVRNRVTLLGEMRAAMAVFQPTVFQKVELA